MCVCVWLLLVSAVVKEVGCMCGGVDGGVDGGSVCGGVDGGGVDGDGNILPCSWGEVV